MKIFSSVVLICTLALYPLCVYGRDGKDSSDSSDSDSDESDKCMSNQVWSNCGSSCPSNCQNKNNPNRICTEMCRRGCVCRPPHVFQSGHSGPCVLPTECP
ncbi:chymotrypsin inhibitor-like [Xenopus tropicalis]|uniref:Chymotrypsin inhibitor-like n=1 Tax=Xenopus tropicalis TaxID=8364 RepID=A0A803J3V2_XENTR|nr:chymotrypsin inhibitor-like [Xenopus tropicalis]